MRRHLRWLTPIAVGLLGCSDDEPPPPLLGPEDCVTKNGTCNSIYCDPGEAQGIHVGTDETGAFSCVPIEYHTNPPSSGDHYPFWATFKEYPAPVLDGFWMHTVEHSAIVLLYNCNPENDPSCAAMLDAIRGWIAAQPHDEKCDAPINSRHVLMPYPELESAFAAVAWGHFMQAECFDEPYVTAFSNAFYGRNYENICTPGIDPLDDPPEGCSGP